MFICIACHQIKHFKCNQYYREHKKQYHSSSSRYICSNRNLQLQLRYAYYYHVKRKCSVGNMKISYIVIFLLEFFIMKTWSFVVICCLNVSNLVGLVEYMSSWIYKFLNLLFLLYSQQIIWAITEADLETAKRNIFRN